MVAYSFKPSFAAMISWHAIQNARPLNAMAGELRPWFRAHRLEALAWRRAKAEAIKRAAGL